MMNPIQIVKAANAIGIKNLLYTLLYTRTKARLDAPAAKKRREWEATPPIVCGTFKDLEQTDAGTVVVRFERAELQVVALEAALLRLTWTPGALPLPYTLDESVSWPGAALTVSKEEQAFIIASAALTLRISHSGALSMSENATRHELLAFDPPARQGERWLWQGPLRAEEAIVGLGQSNGRLNLRGRKRLLWNVEARGDTGPKKDPLYLSIPVYYACHDLGGYLAFFENSYASEFSFVGERRALRFEGGALRVYLTPGPLPQALERYTRLSGRPALPPRWALGYHQARWSYMNEGEVMAVADGFAKNELPLAAIHLDIHYMDGYRVFTIDGKRFPDLARLCATLEARGIKIVTILDPAVKVDEGYDLYRDMKARDLFCKMPDGNILPAPVWPGWAAFPDFTNPRARTYWAEQYRFFTERGVAGIWHDMNEPAALTAAGHPTLPDPLCHDMEGRGGDHAEAHNLYALLEARAGYEGLLAARPDKRPWILTRSGWAGVQRYAWNWTGDTPTSWWSLTQNGRLPLMLGLSGLPYCGPDIGGFMGDPSPELYARWFAAGSFLPFFRTHSSAFVKRREPYSFGEPTTSICRRYLRLRERLLPYWYTLAYEAHRSGAPLVRPMAYALETPQAFAIDDQFLVGSDILVAPIGEAKAVQRRLLLPRGEWLYAFDGAVHSGPGEVEVAAPLAQLPFFLRAGSALPLAEDGLTVWRLLLAPSTTTLCGELTLDSGDGYGPSSRYRLSGERAGSTLTIHLTREGEFADEQGLALAVHGATILAATREGRALALDAKGRLPLPPESLSVTLTIGEVTAQAFVND